VSRDDVLDLPPAEVEEILKLHYGVTTDTIEVVSGELATVCRVASGRRLLAFKAIPAPDDEAATLIRWQTSAMIKLARQGLPVPAVQLDIDGQPVVERLANGRRILIQVSEWLTDPPMIDVPVDPPLLRSVGEIAARVNLALSELTAPVPTRHPWELIRTGDTVGSLVDQVHDPRIADLARRALAIFDQDLAPLLARLPWTVLHHDLHDSNLLIGEGPHGQRVVTGILDFGDMTYGPRLAELAVAATYAARNSPDPQSALVDVAAGWAAVLPLTPQERIGLLPAVISRLATNVTVWASRRSGPRAQYARDRMAGADETLAALLRTNPAKFLADLRNRRG
jgi:Ser/Thr protein kinase RdoA (MazF antagonist)